MMLKVRLLGHIENVSQLWEAQLWLSKRTIKECTLRSNLYFALVEFSVNVCVCVFSTNIQPSSVRNCASVS